MDSNQVTNGVSLERIRKELIEIVLDIGHHGMKTLDKICEFVTYCRETYQKSIASVNNCEKLAKIMLSMMNFFHNMFENIFDSYVYTNGMSEIFALYITIQLRICKDKRQQHVQIANRIVYLLHTYFGKSSSEEDSVSKILSVLLRISNMYEQEDIMTYIFQSIIPCNKIIATKLFPDKLYMQYILIFSMWMKVVKDDEARMNIIECAEKFMKPKPTLSQNQKYALFLPRYSTLKTATRTILFNIKFFDNLKNNAINDNDVPINGLNINLVNCSNNSFSENNKVPLQNNMDFADIFATVTVENFISNRNVKSECTTIQSELSGCPQFIDLTMNSDDNDLLDEVNCLKSVELQECEKWLKDFQNYAQQRRPIRQNLLSISQKDFQDNEIIDLISDDSDLENRDNYVNSINQLDPCINQRRNPFCDEALFSLDFPAPSYESDTSELAVEDDPTTITLRLPCENIRTYSSKHKQVTELYSDNNRMPINSSVNNINDGISLTSNYNNENDRDVEESNLSWIQRTQLPRIVNTFSCRRNSIHILSSPIHTTDDEDTTKYVQTDNNTNISLNFPDVSSFSKESMESTPVKKSVEYHSARIVDHDRYEYPVYNSAICTDKSLDSEHHHLYMDDSHLMIPHIRNMSNKLSTDKPKKRVKFSEQHIGPTVNYTGLKLPIKSSMHLSKPNINVTSTEVFTTIAQQTRMNLTPSVAGSTSTLLSTSTNSSINTEFLKERVQQEHIAAISSIFRSYELFKNQPKFSRNLKALSSSSRGNSDTFYTPISPPSSSQRSLTPTISTGPNHVLNTKTISTAISETYPNKILKKTTSSKKRKTVDKVIGPNKSFVKSCRTGKSTTPSDISKNPNKIKINRRNKKVVSKSTTFDTNDPKLNQHCTVVIEQTNAIRNYELDRIVYINQLLENQRKMLRLRALKKSKEIMKQDIKETNLSNPRNIKNKKKNMKNKLEINEKVNISNKDNENNNSETVLTVTEIMKNDSLLQTNIIADKSKMQNNVSTNKSDHIVYKSNISPITKDFFHINSNTENKEKEVAQLLMLEKEIFIDTDIEVPAADNEVCVVSENLSNDIRSSSNNENKEFLLSPDLEFAGFEELLPAIEIDNSIPSTSSRTENEICTSYTNNEKSAKEITTINSLKTIVKKSSDSIKNLSCSINSNYTNTNDTGLDNSNDSTIDKSLTGINKRKQPSDPMANMGPITYSKSQQHNFLLDNEKNYIKLNLQNAELSKSVLNQKKEQNKNETVSTTKDNCMLCYTVSKRVVKADKKHSVNKPNVKRKHRFNSRLYGSVRKKRGQLRYSRIILKTSGTVRQLCSGIDKQIVTNSLDVNSNGIEVSSLLDVRLNMAPKDERLTTIETLNREFFDKSSTVFTSSSTPSSQILTSPSLSNTRSLKIRVKRTNYKNNKTECNMENTTKFNGIESKETKDVTNVDKLPLVSFKSILKSSAKEDNRLRKVRFDENLNDKNFNKTSFQSKYSKTKNTQKLDPLYYIGKNKLACHRLQSEVIETPRHRIIKRSNENTLKATDTLMLFNNMNSSNVFRTMSTAVTNKQSMNDTNSNLFSPLSITTTYQISNYGVTTNANVTNANFLLVNQVPSSNSVSTTTPAMPSVMVSSLRLQTKETEQCPTTERTFKHLKDVANNNNKNDVEDNFDIETRKVTDNDELLINNANHTFESLSDKTNKHRNISKTSVSSDKNYSNKVKSVFSTESNNFTTNELNSEEAEVDNVGVFPQALLPVSSENEHILEDITNGEEAIGTANSIRDEYMCIEATPTVPANLFNDESRDIPTPILNAPLSSSQITQTHNANLTLVESSTFLVTSDHEVSSTQETIESDMVRCSRTNFNSNINAVDNASNLPASTNKCTTDILVPLNSLMLTTGPPLLQNNQVDTTHHLPESSSLAKRRLRKKSIFNVNESLSKSLLIDPKRQKNSRSDLFIDKNLNYKLSNQHDEFKDMNRVSLRRINTKRNTSKCRIDCNIGVETKKCIISGDGTLPSTTTMANDKLLHMRKRSSKGDQHFKKKSNHEKKDNSIKNKVTIKSLYCNNTDKNDGKDCKKKQ